MGVNVTPLSVATKVTDVFTGVLVTTGEVVRAKVGVRAVTVSVSVAGVATAYRPAVSEYVAVTVLLVGVSAVVAHWAE